MLPSAPTSAPPARLYVRMVGQTASTGTMAVPMSSCHNPPSVLEAATVDGASAVSQFFRIKMPLISPIIFYSTIVAVISSFQTFDIVYVLTNDAGPDNATRTMVYHIYDVGYRSAKFGVASAASVILLLITLVVTMIQLAAQKKLVNYDL